MEFDFLPKLPKSDLDTRKFEDLVKESVLRIPRYCPEWTNYNASDPGMTLIELFAWMTDQMLQQFNQVPRRNYVTFLELLGIRLSAPTPAQTDVTFYLVTSLSENYTIPEGTEVATVRTETEQAIVFSTDRPLTIANPTIRHFLSAETTEIEPQRLRDRFTGVWTWQSGQWSGPSLACFNEQPQPGNCFYLVFDSQQPIEGNVIALSLTGEAATPTGINPDMPPRLWEAWNGEFWQPVLMREVDDSTKGFSFSELSMRLGNNTVIQADLLLHLPQNWPVTQFVTYQGRWLRCTCTPTTTHQAAYTRSPRLLGIRTRSIGATVGVTQNTLIRNEILGESDGRPGQSFQLLGTPVLPRQANECILVTPSGGLPQIWQEVSDFANSGAEDLHYTIDSLTGTVQFGPLIQESSHLQEQTWLRDRLQNGGVPLLRGSEGAAVQITERQFGAVPPRGAIVQMAAYRTGGGRRGNVQRGTIRIVKTAVPYIASVINHIPARNGMDAESLEDAALRVPRMLRTRDRAVTAEDFENLALEAGAGAIARALCLSPNSREKAGQVRLLLVPQANINALDRGLGTDPDLLSLTPQMVERVLAYLDERRLLGVEVICQQPEYVGVSVQTEVFLEPEYNNPRAREQILFLLQVTLYRFLNPLTGGPEGNGWPFGRPVYPSDIINLLQKIPGVRYLGTVQLFELRRQNSIWVRTLPREPVIDPGLLGLICSWRNDGLRSGHVINAI